MDTRSSETHGRRLTLADFPPAEIAPILKSRGETIESVRQLEQEYLAAEREGNEAAKKKLNSRLQPIYQALVSLHT